MMPTPMVVLMSRDSSAQQYNTLVRELKMNQTVFISEIVYETVNFRAFTAKMTNCAVDSLLDNPAVSTISQNIQGEAEAFQGDAVVSSRDAQSTANISPNISLVEEQHPRPFSASKKDLVIPPEFANVYEAGSLFDDASEHSTLLNGPPFHLGWLTALWTMTGLPQNDLCKYFPVSRLLWFPPGSGFR